MDYDYMGQLVLSVLIFAPGVVLLAMCAFIGVLVMLEKSGLFGLVAKEEEELFDMQQAAELAANPPEGDVVAGLDQAIRDEAAAEAGDDAPRKSGTADE